ncbi:MAG TPA: hypothetical protein VN113_08970 [Caulobacter sp.]|nr:hypothetical protein [Caulobacter sp.]
MEAATPSPLNPLGVVIAEWLSECDFAVLSHGFLEHGRDYAITIQNDLGQDRGTHILVFTHVVAMAYETAVSDDAWRQSWDDVFLDYTEAVDLDGYVWGTNWSNAYPGLIAPDDDPDALAWANRVGRPMYAMALTTDRFRLRLIYSEVRSRKVGDDVSLIQQTIIPL